MPKPSPAQLDLLREMVQSADRHLIDHHTYLAASWPRGPRKRQIMSSTVHALERLGLLERRVNDDTRTWWASGEGRALVNAEGGA